MFEKGGLVILVDVSVAILMLMLNEVPLDIRRQSLLLRVCNAWNPRT